MKINTINVNQHENIAVNLFIFILWFFCVVAADLFYSKTNKWSKEGETTEKKTKAN